MNITSSIKTAPANRFRSFLPSILGTCCLVGEIATGLAFLGAIVLIPFSQARMADGREGIRINVQQGVFGGLCDFRFGDPRGSSFGSLSVSPLLLGPSAEGKETSPQDLSIREIDGMATIMRPADAARALEYVRWPFILGILCTGATSVVILDLFRRMLGSVAKREVFTAENIRNVNRLGLLFIGASIAKLLLTGWLVTRFVAFVALSQMHGSAALKSFFEGDGSGIGIGLMIIVLAEVFRQGLALKEENQLTI